MTDFNSLLNDSSLPAESSQENTENGEVVDFKTLMSHDDDTDGYFTIYKKGVEFILFLIAAGELQNRDFSILMVFIIHSDWRTGRCKLTVEKLSEVIGCKKATLYPSIRRLKKTLLIVPARDERSGQKLYILSPYVFRGGSGKVRGYMLKVYDKAIQANEGNPDGHSLIVDDIEEGGEKDPW